MKRENMLKLKVKEKGSKMENKKSNNSTTPRNLSYHYNNIRTKKQETRKSSRLDRHDETQKVTPDVLAKPDKTIYREKCKSIESGKINAAKSILTNANNLFRIDVSVVDITAKRQRPRLNIGIVEKSGAEYLHLTSNLVPPDRLREITHNANKHTEFYQNVKEFAQHLNKTDMTYAGKVTLRQHKFYKHSKLIVPKMAAFMIMSGNTPKIIMQIADETFYINTQVYTGKDHKYYPYKGHIQFEEAEEYIDIE